MKIIHIGLKNESIQQIWKNKNLNFKPRCGFIKLSLASKKKSGGIHKEFLSLVNAKSFAIHNSSNSNNLCSSQLAKIEGKCDQLAKIESISICETYSNRKVKTDRDTLTKERFDSKTEIIRKNQLYLLSVLFGIITGFVLCMFPFWHSLFLEKIKYAISQTIFIIKRQSLLFNSDYFFLTTFLNSRVITKFFFTLKSLSLPLFVYLSLTRIYRTTYLKCMDFVTYWMVTASIQIRKKIQNFFNVNQIFLQKLNKTTTRVVGFSGLIAIFFFANIPLPLLIQTRNSTFLMLPDSAACAAGSYKLTSQGEAKVTTQKRKSSHNRFKLEAEARKKKENTNLENHRFRFSKIPVVQDWLIKPASGFITSFHSVLSTSQNLVLRNSRNLGAVIKYKANEAANVINGNFQLAAAFVNKLDPNPIKIVYRMGDRFLIGYAEHMLNRKFIAVDERAQLQNIVISRSPSRGIKKFVRNIKQDESYQLMLLGKIIRENKYQIIDERGEAYFRGLETYYSMLKNRRERTCGSAKRLVIYNQRLGILEKMLAQEEDDFDNFKIFLSQENVNKSFVKNALEEGKRIINKPVGEWKLNLDRLGVQAFEKFDLVTADMMEGEDRVNKYHEKSGLTSLSERKWRLEAEIAERNNTDENQAETEAQLRSNEFQQRQITRYEAIIWANMSPIEQEEIELNRNKRFLSYSNTEVMPVAIVVGNELRESNQKVIISTPLLERSNKGPRRNQQDTSYVQIDFKKAQERKNYQREAASKRKKDGAHFLQPGDMIRFQNYSQRITTLRPDIIFKDIKHAQEIQEQESKNIQRLLRSHNLIIDLETIKRSHSFNKADNVFSILLSSDSPEKKEEKQRALIKKTKQNLALAQSSRRGSEIQSSSNRKALPSSRRERETSSSTQFALSSRRGSNAQGCASLSLFFEDFSELDDYAVIDDCQIPVLLMQQNIDNLSIGFSFDKNTISTENKEDFVKNINKLQNKHYKINLKIQDMSIDEQDLTPSQRLQMSQVERNKISFHANNMKKNINAGRLTSVTLIPCDDNSTSSLVMVMTLGMIIGALGSSLLQKKSDNTEKKSDNTEKKSDNTEN